MLAVIWLAARLVVDRFPASRAREYLGSGVLALMPWLRSRPGAASWTWWSTPERSRLHGRPWYRDRNAVLVCRVTFWGGLLAADATARHATRIEPALLLGLFVLAVSPVVLADSYGLLLDDAGLPRVRAMALLVLLGAGVVSCLAFAPRAVAVVGVLAVAAAHFALPVARGWTDDGW